MKSKLMSIIMAFIMSLTGAGSGGNTPPETIPAEKPTAAESLEFVRDMGLGINLGNTFEACGDWIEQWGDGTPTSYETAWGSPVITKPMIEGYVKAGFKTLRVPVAWSNMIGDDFTISEAYMTRVKEVVDWALECDMYVIVNLHYDNGWLENFPTQKSACMYRYTRIWTQVADAFKNYGDHLIFEGQNEELGWQSVWNQWGGTKGKTESYALVNEINQTFVDIVRDSGGNNKSRWLLIPGYNTGIETTCDKLFKVPDDPAGRLMISVHYYSPSTFAILTEDASWGKAQRTWGTEKELQDLENSMNLLKTTFVDKGIPVIIGEYGCPTENKDMNSVRLFLRSVCESAYDKGMCPVLWSTPGHIYDRNSCTIIDKKIAQSYLDIAKS